MSEESHSGWMPATDLLFAATLDSVALAVGEIPVAAQSLPVGFVHDEAGWRAIAILSPGDGRNRFVSDDGHWIGPYVPALLRAYPFRFDMRNPETLRLWPGYRPSPPAEEARPFTREGQPTDEVRRIHAFLRQVYAGMGAVGDALRLLNERQVLVPWTAAEADDPLRVIAGQVQAVDPQRFHALPDDDWLALRQLDAIGWLYAHLGSLHHAGRFRRPVDTAARSDLHRPAPPDPMDQVSELLSAMAEELHGP